MFNQVLQYNNLLVTFTVNLKCVENTILKGLYIRDWFGYM